MSYGVQYRCTHKSFTNQTETTFKIDILKDGYSGAVTEVLGFDDVFELEYEKIDPTKLHSSPIQSGRLDFKYLVRDATDYQLLTDIFDNDEGTFKMRLYRDDVLLFEGFVLNDMLEISEADYPHQSSIVAKDFTKLKGRSYPLVGDTTYVTIASLIEDLIRPIRDGRSVNYFTSFVNSNVSGSFVDGVYVDKFGLRDFKDVESRDDDLALDRYDILESLLKSFGLIIRQAEGEFQVYQLSGLDSLSTTTVDSDTKYILPSSMTQFNAGIKRAKFAYNHRTVSKEIKMPDKFFLRYDSGEDTIEEGIAKSRAFSQLYNSEQDIRLKFRVDSDFPKPTTSSGDPQAFTDTRNRFARFQIKVVASANTYYFKLNDSLNANIISNEGTWVTQETINSVRLIGGGELEGSELQRYSNVVDLDITNAPAPADGNLTITFFNSAKAELNNGRVQEFILPADLTDINISEFAITGENNRSNSNALAYEIEQDGDFSNVYDHGSVLFGEGPVTYSPLALFYESVPEGGGLIPTPAEYEIILGGWNRGSGATKTLAELLLEEIIGIQSRGTKNLSADFYGNYNGHNKLSYSSVTYFFVGGVLNGDNIFRANFIELNFQTANLGELSEVADGVRANVFSGTNTADIVSFREGIKVSEFFNSIFLSNFVGELSTAIQAGSTITSFVANLSAQIRDGEDFVLVDKINEKPYHVNVIGDYNAGQNVTVTIDEQFIATDLAVGSPVILSGGLLESYFTIDPTKLSISVDSMTDATALGRVDHSNRVAGATFDFIKLSNSLVSADNPVQVKDDEQLVLRSRGGQVQTLVARGDQTYTSSPFQLQVDSFTHAFDVGTASYTTGGVVEVLNVGSSVARIDIKADDNEASITSLTSITTNNGLTSSTNITQRANQTDATVVLKTDFNGNVGAFQMNANADGSTISINADQITVAGQTTFLSALQDNLTFPEGSVVIRSATEPTQRPDGEALEEGDIWIETDEGDRPYSWNGSSWTRQFTQIDGGDITTGTIDADRVFAQNISIPSGGSIASTIYSSGSSGFRINADGSAEFNNVQVRSSNFSSLNSGFELTGSGIQFSEDFTIGSTGGVNTFTIQNPNLATSSLSGSNLAFKHVPLTGSAVAEYRSESLALRHVDWNTLDSSNNELVTAFNFGQFNSGGASPTTEIQATGSGSFTFGVQGDIEYTGTITDISDSLLKENVEPLGQTLDKITQLEAKIYDLIGDSTTREIGLFAQDVEPLFPEAVKDRTKPNEEGEEITYKTLSYIQLIPALIESIKELKQEIDQLKNEQGI